MSTLDAAIKDTIRDVPDFPKPGILFKDITPVLANPALFERIIAHFEERFQEAGVQAVVGMESRGFIFGAPLAIRLGAAFVPARKPGKLPYENVGVEYELEYGTARLEMHVDAFPKGARVLVVDDLLATGGTAEATISLVEQVGGKVVACCFVIELGFLEGRARLGDTPVDAIVQY